jgi:hypothetical protein
MTPRPSPLPDGLGAAFSVADARAAGVSPRRLRGRDLTAPFHGVRMTRAGMLPPDAGEPSDPSPEERAALERIHAYAARMAEGTFFTHVSAARLWGLPLPA